MSHRLKILLCGFVNHANAQNINCSAIARYLDKTKFDVHAFYYSGVPLDRSAFPDVTLHPVSNTRGLARLNPIRIFLRMLLGGYDILYMPKTMNSDIFFAKWFGKYKCLVSSVEGVVTETSCNEPWRKKYIESMTCFFSISRCIQASVEKYWGKCSPLLYLGHECKSTAQSRELVKTVTYAGSIIERKRPLLFLECARVFPDLQFLMIGDGEIVKDVRTYIHNHGLTNVTLTGRIPNAQVYERLQESDLLLMTSKDEGLPKVILEAAACAVPTIYINECYSVDYIEDGKTGYAVPNVQEMMTKIRLLLKNPDTFQQMSKNAQEMSKEYHWSKLIGKYESFFEQANPLVKNKHA